MSTAMATLHEQPETADLEGRVTEILTTTTTDAKRTFRQGIELAARAMVVAALENIDWDQFTTDVLGNAGDCFDSVDLEAAIRTHLAEGDWLDE